MGAKFFKGYHFSLAQVYTTIILYLRNRRKTLKKGCFSPDLIEMTDTLAYMINLDVSFQHLYLLVCV